MNMPSEIIGKTFNGRNGQNLALTFVREGGRPYHGIYTDQNKKEWYVKESDQNSSVSEALAANFFEFIVGKKQTPETHYLHNDNSHYVISEFTKFNELLPGKRYNNLAKSLLASFILSDPDCQPKNIKELDGNVFRIDFGAALNNNDIASLLEHEILPFTTSVKDLHTGFEIEEFSNQLSVDDFIKYQQELKEISIDEFPWEKWLEFADPIELQKWKNLIGQKIQMIHACFNPTHRCSPEAISTSNELKNLQDRLQLFYSELLKSKDQEHDFIFNRLSPDELTNRHLVFFLKNKKHPQYFLDYLVEAYGALDGTNFRKPTHFDQFIVDHFPDKEFRIKRLNIEATLLKHFSLVGPSTKTFTNEDNFSPLNRYDQESAVSNKILTARANELMALAASGHINRDSEEAYRFIHGLLKTYSEQWSGHPIYVSVVSLFTHKLHAHHCPDVKKLLNDNQFSSFNKNTLTSFIETLAETPAFKTMETEGELFSILQVANQLTAINLNIQQLLLSDTADSDVPPPSKKK
jgi:hypothetical protein